MTGKGKTILFLFLIFLLVSCKKKPLEPYSVMVFPPPGAKVTKFSKDQQRNIVELRFYIKIPYESLFVKNYYDKKLKLIGFKDYCGGIIPCSKKWSEPIGIRTKEKDYFSQQFWWSWINFKKNKLVTLILSYKFGDINERPNLQYAVYLERAAVEIEEAKGK